MKSEKLRLDDEIYDKEIKLRKLIKKIKYN